MPWHCDASQELSAPATQMGVGVCPQGTGTSRAAMSILEQFSPPLNEMLFAGRPWFPLSPGDEWGISAP